jgi:hypothetical protein
MAVGVLSVLAAEAVVAVAAAGVGVSVVAPPHEASSPVNRIITNDREILRRKFSLSDIILPPLDVVY